MNKYFLYKNFTQLVFNHLNGMVNNVNVASDIKFSLDNYNSYAYNNNCSIIVFLNKILHEHADDNHIKPIIIDVIIHELFHMDQVLDRSIYNNDLIYTGNIEKQVIFKTSEFVINNHQELQKYFGEFEITRFRNAHSNVYKNVIPYQRITLDKLYSNTIHSWINTVNIELYKNIKIVYHSMSNIKYEVCIKKNGIYNVDTKRFNSLILNNLYTTIRNVDLHVNGSNGSLIILFKEGNMIERSHPIRKVGFSTW